MSRRIQKIREAYEILIDPILKAEYNAFINHKDNINEYRKKGNNALDKNNIEELYYIIKNIAYRT
ncbi:hypothetical protein CBCST_12482 [Clostridium botulinum C str. Stockholm]|nr:hypothetical protein CBCST_12482 [Clostridium botulinum C str. Stockholm]